MELTVSFFLVAGVAILITGISKSGFGGGLGVLSVPLMSLFIAPQLAAAILMPILLAMDVLIVWRFRKSWSRPVVATLLPGAAVGLGLGALAFHAMSADLIRVVVGVLALGFVAQFVWGQRRAGDAPKPARATMLSLAAVSGFASFVAHAGGPPVKGVLLRQRLEKSVFVGTNTMFFFALNASKSVAYIAMGQLTVESLWISLMLSPILFIGIAAGMALHNTISQGAFVRIVYGFLFLAGVKLLWDGRAVVIG